MKTIKNLMYLLIFFIAVSCTKDNIGFEQNPRNPYSNAFSIIVNQNKVLVSGYVNMRIKG